MRRRLGASIQPGRAVIPALLLIAAAFLLPAVAAPVALAHPPDGPSNLTAEVVGSRQVNLSWADNSTEEYGFHIERATDAGFTRGLISFQVKTNITNHADRIVFSSATYYYRVFAFNEEGKSEPSNVVSVTTSGSGGSVYGSWQRSVLIIIGATAVMAAGVYLLNFHGRAER